MSTGDTTAQPPPNTPADMDVAERQIKVAELYAKLADSARNRFDSRRNLEWRAAIGLWTLFGGASGIVLTTKGWVPGAEEVGFSIFFSVVVVTLYIANWVRWINEAHRRDSHIAFFWETGIRECINSLGLERHKDLPAHLDPPADGKDTWAAMTDPEPNNVDGQPHGDARKIESGFHFHSAQWVQILVTICFALMFCGAMLSKSYRSSEAPVPHDGQSRLTLEGNVVIDEASKIKVGR